MRLTLRTLLACMDGVLPASEQEELGAKVAASPIGPKLVERIREAVENPTLTPPEGRGLADDANGVAEFLDNVLPPDQLEAYERTCLESHNHLSEVAACHRILAEVSRDPQAAIPLAGNGRRQLIRAVAEGLSRDDEQASSEPTADEAAAAAASIATEATGSAGRTQSARPLPHREPASVWAWFSALAALALLVALGGLLARSIWPPKPVPSAPLREVTAAEEVPDQSGAAAVPVTDGGQILTPTEVEPEGGALEDKPTPDESPLSDPSLGALAATPGADESPSAVAAVASPPIPRPAATVPLPAMELPIAAPADTGSGPDQQGPEVEEVESAPPPGLVAEGDPLLRLVAGDAALRYQPLFGGEPLALAEELLVPAHCSPELVLGDLKVRLLPATRAAITTDTDGTPRLEIVFGRGVAWTDAPAGATAGISASGLGGVVRLSPRQPIGIEVQLVHRPGDDPTEVTPARRSRVFSTGGIQWRQTQQDGSPPEELLHGIQATESVPPASELVWDSADAGAARLFGPGDEPAWLRPPAPMGRLDKGARDALVNCFKAPQAKQNVVESLRELASDRRAENRMAAASTLALLGEYDELVGLLSADTETTMLREKQWTTLEAAALPLALARGSNAAGRLRQSFVNRAPAGRAAELFRMACRLSPADLAAGGAMPLVEALEDPMLVVRRFALANLQSLCLEDAEARILYRPDRPALFNDRGIAWWRARVQALAGEAQTSP